MSMKKSFKQRMRENENDQKKGYDPVTNTWKPHKSVEKGTDTIAYGHKLKYHGEITSLTENQAIELFNKDYSIHEKNAAKIYDDFTGKKESFKKLETYKKEVFTDIAFNVGNNAENFKKFMTAMRDNDKNKMIEESKTYVNLEGKMKLLERRWKMRAEEINNSWRLNSQENQNINGVDLSYTLNHDKIIGFSYFNDAMSLIYSKDPRNLFDIKLSYLAAALWVEYKEDVLDSNIRFSLDPVGSVHMKKFYPECIKDTDLGQVLFKSDFIMKMLSLDTRNNQQKSIIISKRLRKLGLQPIHEYEKNLPNNSFFSARLWLKLKNADFSFEEGRFYVNSVDIEVQARETVREHGDIFIDKPVQNVNSGAFTFAVNFTRLYDEIAEEFPVFHKLKQVCKAIVLARHIKERNIPVDVTKILDCINWKLNKPESITEIMNKHEKTLGNIKSTLTVSGGVDLSTNDLLFNLLSFQEETKEIFQVRKSHFNHSRIDINQGHFIFQLEKFCVECKTMINPKLLHIYIAESISEYRFLCKYHSDFTCKKCFDVLEGSFCIINGISVHKNCLNCYFCGGLINDQYVEYSNNIFHPECRFPTTPTLHEYDEIDDFMIEDSLMQNIIFESCVDRINQRRDFK